ncbi:MAG: ATPase [Euryarchaeota archaeon]|jgi:V/A-type H+-transporting ATPase subunit K|nr:ATPase [Euryarchaeota archaeon]
MEAGLVAIGAGIALGLAALGTGIAQGNIGAAVVGVVAEDKKFMGRGIFFFALPETILIFGLALAFLLYFKI